MSVLSRPIPSGEDELWAAFYAHCARGELRFQRCEACGSFRHPPRPRCAHCYSPRWTWDVATGRGRVHSWTVVHQPFHPAFAADVPYAVLLGEMQEGVRLMARLRKADFGEIPLCLDLALRVQFEPVSEQIALPLFSIDRSQ